MDTTKNLPEVLDALNDAVFQGKTITNAQKEKASQRFLSRQLTRGRFSGLFAPTRPELDAGIRLFTGERLHTHLGPRNVCSAEIGRLGLLLGLPDPQIKPALERLQQALLASCFVAGLCTLGECAHSGAAFMRYLAAGGAPDSEARLYAHLRHLANARDGRGAWRRFPFYYTLLALAEIDLPPAVAELRYAASHRRQPPRPTASLPPEIQARRHLLWERVLARC